MDHAVEELCEKQPTDSQGTSLDKDAEILELKKRLNDYTEKITKQERLLERRDLAIAYLAKKCVATSTNAVPAVTQISSEQHPFSKKLTDNLDSRVKHIIDRMISYDRDSELDSAELAEKQENISEVVDFQNRSLAASNELQTLSAKLRAFEGITKRLFSRLKQCATTFQALLEELSASDAGADLMKQINEIKCDLDQSSFHAAGLYADVNAASQTLYDMSTYLEHSRNMSVNECSDISTNVMLSCLMTADNCERKEESEQIDDVPHPSNIIKSKEESNKLLVGKRIFKDMNKFNEMLKEKEIEIQKVLRENSDLAENVAQMKKEMVAADQSKKELIDSLTFELNVGPKSIVSAVVDMKNQLKALKQSKEDLTLNIEKLDAALHNMKTLVDIKENASNVANNAKVALENKNADLTIQLNNYKDKLNHNEKKLKEATNNLKIFTEELELLKKCKQNRQNRSVQSEMSLKDVETMESDIKRLKQDVEATKENFERVCKALATVGEEDQQKRTSIESVFPVVLKAPMAGVIDTTNANIVEDCLKSYATFVKKIDEYVFDGENIGNLKSKEFFSSSELETLYKALLSKKMFKETPIGGSEKRVTFKEFQGLNSSDKSQNESCETNLLAERVEISDDGASGNVLAFNCRYTTEKKHTDDSFKNEMYNLCSRLIRLYKSLSSKNLPTEDEVSVSLAKLCSIRKKLMPQNRSCVSENNKENTALFEKNRELEKENDQLRKSLKETEKQLSDKNLNQQRVPNLDIVRETIVNELNGIAKTLSDVNEASQNLHRKNKVSKKKQNS